MMDAWALRHHPCDAPRRSPGLAADENGGAAVPQGHQMEFTPNTLQPRVTPASRPRWGPSSGWNGSTLSGIW